jgi:hypothetical protein
MVKCDIRIAEYVMTQVEDSGHHILPEITGTWKQYSGRISYGRFLCFHAGTGP